MAEKHAAESSTQIDNCTVKNQGGAKLFQTLTVLLIPFLWVGYFYSLYRGNESNMSHYSLMILIFSLLIQDIWFKKEKMQNKILNILANLEGILFVAWAVVTIVLLIIK